MTEKLDEAPAGQGSDFKRVSMLWPGDLKEEVRRIVGNRGLTDFTLDAVRQKLTSLQSDRQPQPSAEPPEPEPDSEPATASAPEPIPEPSGEPSQDPAEIAKLPLTERMAYARTLINGREPGSPATGRCPECQDELVNGECWTCPPRL